MTTTLTWKVFAYIGRTIACPADVGTIAFEAAPSPRIYAHLGLSLDHAYVPLRLMPTATYYQVLGNKLRDLGHPQVANKPPFRITDDKFGEARLYLQARIYPPNIAALTLHLEADSDTSPETALQALLNCRTIDANPVIKEVAAYTLGVINSGDHRRPAELAQVQSYPCFYLQPRPTRREMPSFLETAQPSIVALLLGIKDPAAMSADLITSPIEINGEINKKSTDQLMLLNKQGLIYLTAADDTGHENVDRFAKMANLAEAGWVFQRFLDNYAAERALLEDFSDFMFIQAEAWLEHPAAIFSKSYTSRLAWGIVAGELRLTEKLLFAKRTNAAAMSDLQEKRLALALPASRWWLRPEFAHTFDNALANATRTLGLITDATLRQSILLDLREAERCLNSKCFKAAVVMAGAAVEAMLLALLAQKANIVPARLSTMGLHDYLTEVKAQKLIADVGMIDMLDNSLRNWRNLVHPGKVLRTGVVLTQEHATIAIAAANSLAKSLT